LVSSPCPFNFRLPFGFRLIIGFSLLGLGSSSTNFPFGYLGHF
jgi:hypothetical protein